jgi:transcription factor SPN1
MEDVVFKETHSSPLPEAGNDPDDPLRPEIDEENSTANPTIAAPYQDMEVTQDKEEMPDDDDVQEGGMSDNESVLSDALDDDQMDEQFGEFDASNIAIEERPAQAIDEDTVKQIGVHKRKRNAGEEEKACRQAASQEEQGRRGRCCSG